MRVPTLAELLAAFRGLGYPVPSGIHVVVLRRLPGTVDAFDDMLLLLDGSAKVELACRCTADPGKPSREHPRRRDGTAIIAAGQHLSVYTVGRHKGEYACLVPANPIPVLRYTSLDDTVGEPSVSSSTQIHRASASRESTVVGPWSEGCIVVANPNDFATMMGHVARSGQVRFTLTILEWQ